ncbi:MAG: hypothetical protein HUU21_34380 [Polyangiaceae bacterium]|nr:hypothetical protein [Polyangiaceae bacterium]NUQ78644.1 hypothetical protein [Polyangiaceae bacterium]
MTTSTNDRERAEQSVSARFTRIMNATTSRYGMFSDPPVVALLSGIGLIVLLAALHRGASRDVAYALAGVMVLPIVIALAVTLGLSGARRRVVDWIAGVPFPVENMNAVLNGLGEFLEVQFKEGGPTSVELNKELDQIHPDCFVTKVIPEEGPVETIELRIGVVDSKRNPSASNHLRYERVIAIVERVLVPLSKRFPIVDVRVK